LLLDPGLQADLSNSRTISQARTKGQPVEGKEVHRVQGRKSLHRFTEKLPGKRRTGGERSACGNEAG
jgi:hypothetical protein